MQPSDPFSRIRPRKAKASAGRARAGRPGTRTATNGNHARLLRRLDELDRRLALVQRTLQALSLPKGEAGNAQATTSYGKADRNAGWEAFYAAFEDRFRGSREEILRRQAAHLERLRLQPASLHGLPVLDLGCGRGEWLELLRAHAIRGLGIDTNRVFLAENAARGLEVIEGDALAHLCACPAGSARAVTGFHIIEHLPLDHVRALLDQTLRVLADDGLALFETPNPENLITAACNFYYDPTHLRPIAPAVAAFLLQAHGFRNVEIVRLHPNDGAACQQVPSKLLRELLFGPQDYAVIGYR